MLFQKTITKKYLGLIDDIVVSEAWKRFQAYFLDAQIQANIQQSKEEQFQEGFLRELFVKVLGYTLNPSPNYNLITEKKNETNSKKADGAIQKDGKVIGVIELKDHKTTDLSRIEAQAFGYKSQHRDTRLVIISNFEKLRLYIDNAVDYQEWHLFHLTESDFRELYLCLAWAQVDAGVAIKMKQESVSSEDQITKALYRDYSEFKRVLFADIIANNPAGEGLDEKEWQLLLFKKTQKLLDRLLFIFFAEDCGLLQPNSMVQIIENWQKLKDLDAYVPLYDRIKQYFGYLDTGHQGKPFDVFAYNGGLFKADDVLDNLLINDDLLASHTRKLSTYDFESDVDVNILGHIFENSLSEIEEVTQQINSGETPQTSKRKQDGVFYTPQYITKYIVENTVGRLCSEKKQELNIVEEEYFSDQRRQLKTKQRLLDQLHQYRDWLLQITILDPACGSGAFLNAALQFLMAEHKLIDEMEAKVTGSAIVFQDVENSILEHNLYGVDINEESVEIAQLALWLRTAKPHRKLNSLNENIKCGNSLISDPVIAGEKAFNWQEQFPKVFEKGGFDVVIGNPPYVRAEIIAQKDIDYYRDNYKVFNPDGDLFSYFYEKGMNMLKTNGLFGFISNTFDKTAAGKTLRNFIQTNTKIEGYVDFTEVQIFEGATTYPIILLLSKEKEEKHTFEYTKIPKDMQGSVIISSAPTKEVKQDGLDSDNWSFQSAEMSRVITKISSFKSVKEQYGKCYRGLLTGLNDAFIINEETRVLLNKENAKSDELIKPIYEGKDLQKWCNQQLQKYLICTHNGYDDVPAIDIDKYPAIKDFLVGFEPQLSKRYDKGNTPYNLRNCAYQSLFYQPKIIWGNLQNANKFSWDDKGTIISAPACMLPANNKALLAVLNSKIVWLFLTSICVVRNGGYIEVKPQYFEQIPIPPLDNELGKELSDIVDAMLVLNEELQEKRTRFLRRLSEFFEGVKITSALQVFDQLDFKGFVAELKKQKIKLTLVQQDEWEDYFNQYRQACQELSEQIKVTDNEIDNRVFDLYGLTTEEREIVLNS
ncbi:Eco57I restriction-modification methylase domain-containing protein [Xylanibacter brevis]|uniref:Eco57I restriction-modification methylase domain-containing protein n=1 Tax=Xylanibacter brevis TaxID=83231 RepID=UPI0005C62270|nr:N-6 DNA methylase [Xylanibacter brevis]